jgi:tetratricopeptide (TPR) repeat protein
VAAVAMVAISWLGLVAMENAERASESATLAEERRGEAEQRAEELEQVARFQEEQLSGIDVPSMGWGIRGRLMAGARAAGERVRRDKEVLDLQAVELEQLIAGTDFTGVALETLDEHVFEGALEALEDFEGPALVRARLLQTLARTLRELGLPDRALEPQEQALEIRRSELGDRDPITLKSINSYGLLLGRLGRVQEAERLHREALEGLRLQPDEEALVAPINGLGSILLEQDRHDEAERLFREACEICRGVYRDDHEATMVSRGNLGTLLTKVALFDEAEVHLRMALEISRSSAFRDNARHRQTAINNLASLLQQLDRVEESEALFREALEISRRGLSDEHQMTVLAIGNLGNLLLQQEKVEEAEPLFQEALETSQRTLSREHGLTLFSMRNLANLYQQQERLGEAEALLREVLELGRRTRPPEDLDTLFSMNGLATVLHELGRSDEAVLLLQEALAGFQRGLRPGHPFILGTKANLDAVLEMQAAGKATPPEPPDGSEDRDGQ